MKLKGGRSGPPPMDPKKSYINPGDEDQMEIQGYKMHPVKQVVTWVFIFLTLGLLRLFFHWFPQYKLEAMGTKCSLEEAEFIILLDQWLQVFASDVIIMTKDGTRVKVLKSSMTPAMYYRKERSNSRTGLTTDSHQQTTGSDEKEKDLVTLNPDESLIRYFTVKKIKYRWSTEKYAFNKITGLSENIPCSHFHSMKGISMQEQYQRRAIYDTNKIEVHVTPIYLLFFQEAISPFYIFQLFSVSVWFSDQYEYYAGCILLMSAISLTLTIYQTRKMQRALRNTLHSSTIASVCRGGDIYDDIPSEDLVPGDVIEIPRHGAIMQCDAVLVSGNCIVNESMLTGESVPVTKTPIPNPHTAPDQNPIMLNMKDHSHHVLFCGTNVIQTRFYGSQRVRAVVIRTGFSTAKGDLVRSIMFPKPVDFRFNRDTYKFIGILAFIAVLGFIYTVVIMIERKDAPSDIIIRTLDLITITVPPALPAALTVGIVYAQSRLKRGLIYCISPRSINVCGSINVFCFDKTGTLTEDGLDMQGVVPVIKSVFGAEMRITEGLPNQMIAGAMATCHSLTIIDGVICGDPLDLIMFEATGWDLEEPGHEETRFDSICPTIVHPKASSSAFNSTQYLSENPQSDEIGIVRQFTFSSSLQRMSVIVRRLGAKNFELYSKGSPEMIKALSLPETVPLNFQETLTRYTKHGYRVIAVAWKALPVKLNYVKVQRIQRENVEKGLHFLGLLVMENRLKPETEPVIHQMLEANIRTVMVTGDNMLTALSVARECGMVERTDQIILVQAYPGVNGETTPELEFVYADDREKRVEEVITQYGKNTSIKIDEENKRFHFAMTGKSWALIRQHYPDVISKIAVRGTVFARMAPEQKGQLVESLQELGYYVGMCGDGANDCGALKMAHAGISLSEAEASVASAFTSKKPDIECVPRLIREGRAALVTSFGIFKYMASYSLTQFITVLILYWVGANLTDFEFLWIDLFVLTTLSASYGRTDAYEKLSKDPPTINLVSVSPVLSLILQMMIMMGFQVFTYFYVKMQPWFEPYHENEDESYSSHVNTAVFCVSSFQYITLAVIFSKGAPYRKMFFTNYIFVANLAVCTGITLLITVYCPIPLAEFLELEQLDSIPFRLILVGIAAVNFLLCLVVEMFFIESSFVRFKCQEVTERCLRMQQFQYSAIEQEFVTSPDWPPVSASTTNLVEAFSRLESHDPAMHDKDAGVELCEEDYLDSDNDTASLTDITNSSYRGRSNYSGNIKYGGEKEPDVFKSVPVKNPPHTFADSFEEGDNNKAELMNSNSHDVQVEKQTFTTLF